MRAVFAPPLIEEVYNLEDALVVAGFLQSFVRHADVLKIANLAQIVNVIAPILTRKDGLLVQSIYWPFAMMSSRREGTSLCGCSWTDPTTRRRATAWPRTSTPAPSSTATGCTSSSPTGTTGRRRSDSTRPIETSPRSRAPRSSRDRIRRPATTGSAPEADSREPFGEFTIRGGKVTLRLPAMSFTAATFQLA